MERIEIKVTNFNPNAFDREVDAIVKIDGKEYIWWVSDLEYNYFIDKKEHEIFDITDLTVLSECTETGEEELIELTKSQKEALELALIGFVDWVEWLSWNDPSND